MQAIEPIRSHLKAHPVVALVLLALAALLSVPVALALAGVAALVLLAPEAIRKHAPELVLEQAIEAARKESLGQLMTTSAMGADLKLLERHVAIEQQKLERIEARATRAMLAGDEAEARRCIEEKGAHLARHAELTAELEKQRPAVDAMTVEVDENLKAAAELRRDAPARGLFLVVQKRRVDARKEMLLRQAGLSERPNPLSKMAADVQREEDEVDALESLVARRRADRVAEREQHYAEVERDEAVDAEFEALRQRVGLKRKALGNGTVGS